MDVKSVSCIRNHRYCCEDKDLANIVPIASIALTFGNAIDLGNVQDNLNNLNPAAGLQRSNAQQFCMLL